VSIRKNLKKYLFSALIKALIGTGIFMLVYTFSNIQVIKSFAEDIAFDLLNKIVLEEDSVKLNCSNVMIFGVDNYYLRSQKMLDDDNTINYGLLFPRDKIADFIHNIDSYLEKKIAIDKQPKALFIDYDMSFKYTMYNKAETPEDKKLIEVLKEPRNYVILFPKNNKYNYIESSTDKQIQALIKSKKIQFVSVALARSEDFVTKRYIPFEEYKYGSEEKTKRYSSISTVLYELETGKEVQALKEQDVVQNRIIIKSYKPSEFQDKLYNYRQSNWENMYYYSANYPLNNIVNENFHNAIIFFGSTYKTSMDVFNVNSLSNNKLSGLEVHANTLMTLLYYDGKLKQYSFWMSVVLVFVVFFLVDVLVYFLLDKLNIMMVEFEIIISLVIITVVMVVLSIFILVHYREWFNWFIPVLLFEVVEVFEFIDRYIVKVFNKD